MIQPLNSSYFENRRQTFIQKLSDRIQKDFVAVIPAHPEVVRNDDVHFKFRQESNFFYLTGFLEPDAIAVLKNINGNVEYHLFVRPKDLEKEIWDGYRCGVDGAVQHYLAHQAYSIDHFEKVFPDLIRGAEAMAYTMGTTLHRNGIELLDDKILRLLLEQRRSLGRSGRSMMQLVDPREVLGEMRLFKSPEEIAFLKEAGRISAKAHVETMARIRPGLYEYQVEALLEYFFKNEGSHHYGYPSIVAAGVNSTILHYREHRSKLNDNDLLLIDAGTECESYTADITRTFPINGKMTDKQRAMYEIVLETQKECISRAKPGTTLVELNQFVIESMVEGLKKLNFFSKSSTKFIEDRDYRRYFPHNTSHYLGMDVHDAGLYQVNGAPRTLEPGMCFTIEPGLYVLKDDTQAPAGYQGIGIRIEDDVVITEKGCEVLTAGVPKEIEDMQAIIGTKPWFNG